MIHLFFFQFYEYYGYKAYTFVDGSLVLEVVVDIIITIDIASTQHKVLYLLSFATQLPNCFLQIYNSDKIHLKLNWLALYGNAIRRYTVKLLVSCNTGNMLDCQSSTHVWLLTLPDCRCHSFFHKFQEYIELHILYRFTWRSKSVHDLFKTCV